MGSYRQFPVAIPHLGVRSIALLALSPLSPPKGFSFDLHVLAMPPAFNLSQDQTLQLIVVVTRLLRFRHQMESLPDDSSPSRKRDGLKPVISSFSSLTLIQVHKEVSPPTEAKRWMSFFLTPTLP